MQEKSVKANEILMIRRSFASMTTKEREIMQNLVKQFTKSKSSE